MKKEVLFVFLLFAAVSLVGAENETFGNDSLNETLGNKSVVGGEVVGHGADEGGRFGVPIYLQVMIFVVLVLGGYIVYNMRKEMKRDPNAALTDLRFSIKGVKIKKAGGFASGGVNVLSLDDNLVDVMELFLAHSVNVLPVVSGKRLEGILIKADLISKLNYKNIGKVEEIKVREVMEKKFDTLEADADLGLIYKVLIKSKAGCVAILDKGKFYGLIDYLDILDMFVNSDFEIENPPLVKEAMNRSVNKVNPEIDVYELMEQFVEKDVDYAVVLKDKKIDGIVTTKDILSQVNKKVDLKKISVQNIMSPRVVTFKPGSYISDAMKEAVSRRFNQIPVVMGGNVVGILSLRGMVRVYYEYVSEIEDVRKKFLVRSVKEFKS